jgi:hypothetical protein
MSVRKLQFFAILYDCIFYQCNVNTKTGSRSRIGPYVQETLVLIIHHQ